MSDTKMDRAGADQAFPEKGFNKNLVYWFTVKPELKHSAIQWHWQMQRIHHILTGNVHISASQ